MEDGILKILIEQSPLIGLLGIISYHLWKRYEKFTDRTRSELEDLRKKMESYILNDRQSMQDVITRNAKAIESQVTAMNRNTEVMGCLIHEIQEFKSGELYQEHQSRMQKMAVSRK